MKFLGKLTGEHGYLADNVYILLKKHIINGNLKPGERLIESELANQLEISRTPIREAINRLKREELVVGTPNNGVFVSEISIKDIEDIYNLRKVLEIYAIELAVHRLYLADIYKLEDNIIEAEKKLKENDIEKIFSLNSEFHSYIYQMTQDKRLQKILKELMDTTARYRLITLHGNQQTKNSITNHKQILAALKKRDLDKARKSIAEDVNQGKEVMIKLLSKGEMDLK